MKHLICLMLIAGGLFIGWQEYEKTQYTVSYQPVRVASGDTLWSIADRFYTRSLKKIHALEC